MHPDEHAQFQSWRDCRMINIIDTDDGSYRCGLPLPSLLQLATSAQDALTV
jgi:hypothetical protein